MAGVWVRVGGPCSFNTFAPDAASGYLSNTSCGTGEERSAVLTVLPVFAHGEPQGTYPLQGPLLSAWIYARRDGIWWKKNKLSLEASLRSDVSSPHSNA